MGKPKLWAACSIIYALLWVTLFSTAGSAPSLGSLGRLLAPRADCETETVQPDDTCAKLAERCGISGADFTDYNPDPDLCSSLSPGQRVCCSEGTLPDIRPQPYPNGTCASYVIKQDDTCSSLEAKNGLKDGDIDEFNKVKTWGFNSCQAGLKIGLKICLSSGDAPMPAPDENAICGPTKPGSRPPEGDERLQDLNPCPLNACCNIWGQCGISGDFCIPTEGEFGNIGTGPPGSNGCVQNCGTDIVNNGDAPARRISVGYFETWNMDRECMNMPVRSIRSFDSTYTHVHWAFAEVYQNLSVGINDTYRQWGDFVALPSGTNRIIAFGGWGVSTSPETYDILRRACAPENREAFAEAVVTLVTKYMLDGVDFDWEYPGAKDIPNIPPGLDSDGENYLEMLKVVREKLPEGKSISIAAPASYWYLKSFPIDEIAQVVDYIVYMTYDLHGQWDYGSEWASPGCPAGDCLRSHVNITETMLALSMVTKAGVPSSKIVVGLSSYGRSFKMTDPNCSGPMCTFVGPESAAKKGMCTDTAGYLGNAEIDRIIKGGGDIQSWYDEETMSDYLVYEGAFYN
ncbi:hypothetical protein SLS62_004073 [Diatrype stigma]|uniref:chitinase n=1 Tax=Diatrype stigma TaxID=117547 RepID=A0AAN9V3V5_9PEZI